MAGMSPFGNDTNRRSKYDWLFDRGDTEPEGPAFGQFLMPEPGSTGALQGSPMAPLATAPPVAPPAPMAAPGVNPFAQYAQQLGFTDFAAAPNMQQAQAAALRGGPSNG